MYIENPPLPPCTNRTKLLQDITMRKSILACSICIFFNINLLATPHCECSIQKGSLQVILIAIFTSILYRP